jgi:hypothetical protein
MTGELPMDRGEGERLHAQRRRRFWTILGGLLVVGLVAGFASGFLAGFNDARSGGSSAYMTVGTIGVIVLVLGAAYGSWKFFVNVDEVEVADNLWGSLVGFYTYALLFPAWWALNKLGQLSDPDDWAIFGASMLVGVAVYLYRKLRYR